MNLKLTRENIWILLISFMMSSFAFSERINSWGIASLIIFFLIDKQLLFKIKNIRFNKKLLAPTVFFLIYFIVFLLSEKHADASHALVSKLSLLLLPILFFIENYFSKKNEKRILLIFSTILSISFIYVLFSSIYKNIWIAEIPSMAKAFNRMYISYPIMHPGYFSNYFMFGILWHFFNKTKYTYFFIGLFTLAIILLISKIVIIFYIVFIAFAVYRLIKKSNKPILTTVSSIVVSAVVALLLYQIPAIKHRINETTQNINNTSSDVDISSSTDSRRIAYEQELRLVAAKPIIGYGIGNSKTVLRNHLVKVGYPELGKEMNNHNQYLKTWMDTGIIGFIALISLILLFFKYFKNEKLHVAYWFTLMVALGLATDDMLEIQAGIVFFTLIWSLYLTQRDAATSP